MDRHGNLEETNSFIDHKIFLGHNIYDDFLAGSDLFSKSTKEVNKVEYLQDKIFALQNDKRRMKDIFEEEMFKLKQHYETLRTSFAQFRNTMMNLLFQAQFQIEQKRALSFSQRELEVTIFEMRNKITNIEVSNLGLKQQNEKMLNEIQVLRAAVNRNMGLETKIINKYHEDKSIRSTQSVEKERMLKYLEYKEEQALKTKRYDSRQTHRSMTITQPYSPLNRNLRFTTQRSNLISPIAMRQRGSELTQDSGAETSRLRETTKKDNSFTFTRARQEVIQEQERPKLITRKPGVPTTFYKPPRHPINLTQLETKLESIKRQIKNQIRSVEKRRM